MTPPCRSLDPKTVAQIIACLFVINIWFCIPAMYVFNELQQEGLGAAKFRHALITSNGCVKFKGQAAHETLSQQK